MKKRLFLILLLSALAVALCSCGPSDANKNVPPYNAENDLEIDLN